MKRCNPKVFEDLRRYVEHQKQNGISVPSIAVFKYQLDAGLKRGLFHETDSGADYAGIPLRVVSE